MAVIKPEDMVFEELTLFPTTITVKACRNINFIAFGLSLVGVRLIAVAAGILVKEPERKITPKPHMAYIYRHLYRRAYSNHNKHDYTERAYL